LIEPKLGRNKTPDKGQSLRQIWGAKNKKLRRCWSNRNEKSRPDKSDGFTYFL